MIHFGTSGWRAVIADEFTVENVKLVTQSIADYVLKTVKIHPTVIVGYDTRFMSETFAKSSAEVLAGNKISVLFCQRDTPTPVIGYEIVRRKIAGGINFTASHNPPEYNGIKFSPSWGGPALPEVTRQIESRAKILHMRPGLVQSVPFDTGTKSGLIKTVNPQPDYLKRIRQLVNLNIICQNQFTIITDLLYGTGRGYLDVLLKETGSKVTVLHDYRDVLFGGAAPEPNESNLNLLRTTLRKEKLQLGLSVDGDADRFGIVDEDGTFLVPNQVLTLLLYYLVEGRNLTGVVARTVMTTHFVDAVAKKYGIPVRETPVGFKYIGEIMEREPMIIGGEESGGLTIQGHIPEKDGILACLLMTELRAWTKKPFKFTLEKLYREVGRFYTHRINFRLLPDQVDRLREKLSKNPPSNIAGFKVKEINTIDGFKFILTDNSWVGIRLSGTEPVVRYYIDTNTESKLNKFIKYGNELCKTV